MSDVDLEEIRRLRASWDGPGMVTTTIEQTAIRCLDQLLAERDALVKQLERRDIMLKEVMDERREWFGRAQQLERELAEAQQYLEATKQHAQQEWQRAEQAEARLAAYEKEYKLPRICLICGQTEPCMTEADLKLGDPGIPCTFDPTPRQLFDSNKYLRKRLQAVTKALEEIKNLSYGQVNHTACITVHDIVRHKAEAALAEAKAQEAT